MDRRYFLDTNANSSHVLVEGHLIHTELGVAERPRAGSPPRLRDVSLVDRRNRVRSSIGARRRRILRMSGYRPTHPILYRVWNQGMAFALILFALPLLTLISLALALTQGPRHVFYTGERIGLHGRPFRIIKFKTLKDVAATATKDRVLPTGSGLETTLGKPLRETRLDELPQLINVLFGTMNLLGPRPVRAAIAERWRPLIPNYDKRFDVRPGLIGYTQALMPHSTAKTVRARLNAMLCDRPVNLTQEALFLGVTAVSVGLWSLDVAMRLARSALGIRSRGYAERHGVAEVCATNDPPTPAPAQVKLVRLDRANAEVVASRPMAAHGDDVHLVLRRRPNGARMAGGKAVRCRAVIVSCEPVPGQVGAYRHTIAYHNDSPFREYLIERYFLGSVLVRAA